MSVSPSIDLEKLEYENTRDIALRIINSYPPEKYHYVGVGRSMTPVVTILKELFPTIVFSLPLSTMYYRPQKHGGFEDPLSPEIEARLFDHFQRFLPTKEQTQGKEILFLDFVVGGGSAVATEQYLNKFSKEKRPDLKVKMLIFSPLARPEEIAKANKDYDVITTRGFDVLSQRWMFSWFDNRSEYGSFSYPFEGSDRLKPNSSKDRQEFLELYRARVRKDEMLDGFFKNCVKTFRTLAKPWAH